jgi:hypothetical protein
VARNAAGERELNEEFSQSGFVPADVRINLAVSALEICVAYHRRPAVPGAGDIDHIKVIFFDDPVQVGVNEILAGRRAPVAEQHAFHVRQHQRPFQQRIVVKKDLPDRQVFGGAPIGIHPVEQFGRECLGIHDSSGFFLLAQ